MGEKGILYIAGPMAAPRATKEQKEKFKAAEDKYTLQGWKVINPTVCVPPFLQRRKAIKFCTDLLNTADAILLLPRWQDSEGSRVERWYAGYIGLKVLTENDNGEAKLLLSAERCQAAEIIMALHHAGGCDAAEEWAKGYDDGISEAIRIVEEISGVSFGEAEEMEDWEHGSYNGD